MTPKASDLAARLAASATGARAQVESPSQEDERSKQRTEPSARDVQRFLVNLPRAQHRFIRQFALDIDSDVSTIIRTLLTMVETDPVVAEDVRTRLRNNH